MMTTTTTMVMMMMMIIPKLNILISVWRTLKMKVRKNITETPPPLPSQFIDTSSRYFYESEICEMYSGRI